MRINEQVPPEIYEQKRKLIVVMKAARSDGKRCRLANSRPYIENQQTSDIGTRWKWTENCKWTKKQSRDFL